MAIFAIYLELPGFFNTWMSRWPPFFLWNHGHFTTEPWTNGRKGTLPLKLTDGTPENHPSKPCIFGFQCSFPGLHKKVQGEWSSAKNHPVSDLGSVRYRPSPIHKASWEVSAPPVEDSVPRSPRCPLTRSSPGPGRDVFSGMSFSIHFWAWDQRTAEVWNPRK